MESKNSLLTYLPVKMFWKQMKKSSLLIIEKPVKAAVQATAFRTPKTPIKIRRPDRCF
jgi:hypothetical protein